MWYSSIAPLGLSGRKSCLKYERIASGVVRSLLDLVERRMALGLYRLATVSAVPVVSSWFQRS